jgi:hypothetical protein
MLVKKKVDWDGWFLFVGFFVMLGYWIVGEYVMPHIIGYQLLDSSRPDSIKISLMIFIIETAYFLIAGGVFVFLLMWFDEKKKINFYTSKRFKTERRVLLAIFCSIWLLIFILILLDASKGLSITESINGLLLLIEMVPFGTYCLYFLLYRFAFFLGIRKGYYDNSLDD